MKRRKVKGQKAKNASFTLLPGEMDLIVDESVKEGITKSAVIRKMIEYYFGEDYEAFMKRAAERSLAGNLSEQPPTVTENAEQHAVQG